MMVDIVLTERQKRLIEEESKTENGLTSAIAAHLFKTDIRSGLVTLHSLVKLEIFVVFPDPLLKKKIFFSSIDKLKNYRKSEYRKEQVKAFTERRFYRLKCERKPQHV